jgi:hypothetical protein
LDARNLEALAALRQRILAARHEHVRVSRGKRGHEAELIAAEPIRDAVRADGMRQLAAQALKQ